MASGEAIESNALSIDAIRQILPHRYPFLLLDRVLDYEAGKRIIALKNVTVNEPFFQGHFPDNPIMPGVLILEALAQAGGVLMLKDSEFRGRYAFFASMDRVKFRRPVVPGDPLRLEMECLKIRDNFVKMKGHALVEGRVVAEGELTFSLSHLPSRPQIHPTASVDRSSVIGKDVVIGANTIIGEHVIIGDRTTIEANCMVEKWTNIGQDCHIHFGCVVGSSAQDVKYKGEKSWVVIGDRNVFREYVTINRATGKDATTSIGSDNMFLTHVHIAHNCKIQNNVIIANQTTLGGHTTVGNRAVLGGMTGIHQFVRIGEGAMVGAYTRLPQDVPPYMLCEGNPALIHGLNLIGLRRSGVSRASIAEIKDIHKVLYRSDLNTSQAIKTLSEKGFETEEANRVLTFVSEESNRGFMKKAKTD